MTKEKFYPIQVPVQRVEDVISEIKSFLPDGFVISYQSKMSKPYKPSMSILCHGIKVCDVYLHAIPAENANISIWSYVWEDGDDNFVCHSICFRTASELANGKCLNGLGIDLTDHALSDCELTIKGYLGKLELAVFATHSEVSTMVDEDNSRMLMWYRKVFPMIRELESAAMEPDGNVMAEIMCRINDTYVSMWKS